MKPELPSLVIKNSTTVEDELLSQAKEGLRKRLENFILIKKKVADHKKIENLYNDRLNHEINIINSMNYPSYFLIVSDYIIWAIKNKITVHLKPNIIIC